LDELSIELTGTSDLSRPELARLLENLHRRHNTNLCYLRDVCYTWRMPRDEQITYADHLGRFYARRYAYPPMVGRVLGYLLVCEPRDQTIAELSEALLASRSAITGALSVLERTDAVRRSRAAGERMDRVRIDMSSAQARGFDISEYQELSDLAREGLEVLSDAPPERRAELLELAAFAEFLVESTQALRQEWEARREALRASGELPS
jgi:DNA-binding transcriptional regulator GbsR (MarR family)